MDVLGERTAAMNCAARAAQNQNGSRAAATGTADARSLTRRGPVTPDSREGRGTNTRAGRYADAFASYTRAIESTYLIWITEVEAAPRLPRYRRDVAVLREQGGDEAMLGRNGPGGAESPGYGNVNASNKDNKNAAAAAETRLAPRRPGATPPAPGSARARAWCAWAPSPRRRRSLPSSGAIRRLRSWRGRRRGRGERWTR